LSGGPKRWFMLQMWRLQQIAQIATLVLLAINLTIQIYPFMTWRGWIFSSPYTGMPFILLVLVAIIWGFSIVWDLRMRMWREQASVMIEKNPYAREKMTAKEVAVYGALWLPLMDNIGKSDPEVKKAAQLMRNWIKKAYAEDKTLVSEIDGIMHYLGEDKAVLEDLLKK
jgi:hypothetical protein